MKSRREKKIKCGDSAGTKHVVAYRLSLIGRVGLCMISPLQTINLSIFGPLKYSRLIVLANDNL